MPTHTEEEQRRRRRRRQSPTPVISPQEAEVGTVRGDRVPMVIPGAENRTAQRPTPEAPPAAQPRQGATTPPTSNRQRPDLTSGQAPAQGPPNLDQVFTGLGQRLGDATRSAMQNLQRFLTPSDEQQVQRLIDSPAHRLAPNVDPQTAGYAREADLARQRSQDLRQQTNRIADRLERVKQIQQNQPIPVMTGREGQQVREMGGRPQYTPVPIPGAVQGMNLSGGGPAFGHRRVPLDEWELKGRERIRQAMESGDEEAIRQARMDMATERARRREQQMAPFRQQRVENTVNRIREEGETRNFHERARRQNLTRRELSQMEMMERMQRPTPETPEPVVVGPGERLFTPEGDLLGEGTERQTPTDATDVVNIGGRPFSRSLGVYLDDSEGRLNPREERRARFLSDRVLQLEQSIADPLFREHPDDVRQQLMEEYQNSVQELRELLGGGVEGTDTEGADEAPPAPRSPDQLEDGRVYTLPNGRRARWDASTREFVLEE